MANPQLLTERRAEPFRVLCRLCWTAGLLWALAACNSGSTAPAPGIVVPPSAPVPGVPAPVPGVPAPVPPAPPTAPPSGGGGITISAGGGGFTIQGAPDLHGDPAACAAFRACCAPHQGQMSPAGLACGLAPAGSNGDCAAALQSIRGIFGEQGIPLPPGC